MVRPRSLVALLLLALVCHGCAGRAHLRSSPVEFLYPAGTPPVDSSDVTLKLPLRVGVAFIPDTQSTSAGMVAFGPALTAAQQQTLLVRIRRAFEARADLDRIEIVPS